MPSLQDEFPVEHEGIGLYGERPLIFPFRLHSLLSAAKQIGVDDIVSWDESGTKLIIFNLEEFVSKVLPTVFRQSYFASFRRQMNAYGFEREAKTTKSRSSPCSTLIVYSHKHFHRDKLASCEKIIRRRSKQRKETAVPLCPSQYDPSAKNVDIAFPKEEINFSRSEVHNAKTDGNINFPFMIATPKVYSTNDASLSRMYERTMHQEVRQQRDMGSMQSRERTYFNNQESINEPYHNAFKSSDDELDELAEMVFNSELSGCDEVDGISWDPCEESLSSLSSVNSRAA